MRLTEHDALARLTTHHHGVLATLHPRRGPDAVPVVYAASDGFVGVPVDLVKPKAAGRLQRERNLEADPRATLLVEHWDPDDWSRLWWVRAELVWQPEPADMEGRLADGLASGVEQYRDRPFARVLAFRIVTVTGWSAASA